MIDRATVDRILDAARIVDVVGEFVTLRRAGTNYKGLCPFHDDRNPSFMVSPSKNICKCFVCGKGGTPVGFLMEHEQMTYPDALRWLAKKYSIEIVEKELTEEDRREQSDRESMFIVNEWARDFFHHTLLHDADGQAVGLQYFRSRGIRDDIIEKFQLGFCPVSRTALANEGLKRGYKEDYLVRTGLCIKGERGLYDRFSGRAIFPWLNVSGKVVAFGGRVLDARTKGVSQKYVNSPESDIYHKERELYGLFQAKRAIARENRVFMVEGYTDVIAMHQAGIENVVANSGTALSTHQVYMLNRFTQNITLLYDGDEAGIHAAMRGTNMLLEAGMKVKVLLLPDGDDPDSFARKHSTEELRDYIDKHQTDFIVFKSRLLVENVDDPIRRSEGITDIVESIAVIPNQILRQEYIGELSRRASMREEALIAEMNKAIRRHREEKAREAEREERREATMAGRYDSGTISSPVSIASSTENPADSATAPTSSSPDTVAAPDKSEAAAAPTSVVSPAGSATAPSVSTPVTATANPVERLLMQEIVRNGEQVIFDNVETEDGKTVSVTVAQYISIDMEQDQLTFSSPIYQQMLNEVVAHSGEPSFKAEIYLTRHYDQNISRIASDLALDRHILLGRFQVEQDQEALRNRVVHLMMDFRLRIIDAELIRIQQQMRRSSDNIAMQLELIRRHKDMRELRDLLARRLGSDVK